MDNVKRTAPPKRKPVNRAAFSNDSSEAINFGNVQQQQNEAMVSSVIPEAGRSRNSSDQPPDLPPRKTRNDTALTSPHPSPQSAPIQLQQTLLSKVLPLTPTGLVGASPTTNSFESRYESKSTNLVASPSVINKSDEKIESIRRERNEAFAEIDKLKDIIKSQDHDRMSQIINFQDQKAKLQNELEEVRKLKEAEARRLNAANETLKNRIEALEDQLRAYGIQPVSETSSKVGQSLKASEPLSTSNPDSNGQQNVPTDSNDGPEIVDKARAEVLGMSKIIDEHVFNVASRIQRIKAQLGLPTIIVNPNNRALAAAAEGSFSPTTASKVNLIKGNSNFITSPPTADAHSAKSYNESTPVSFPFDCKSQTDILKPTTIPQLTGNEKSSAKNVETVIDTTVEAVGGKLTSVTSPVFIPNIELLSSSSGDDTNPSSIISEFGEFACVFSALDSI